MKKHFLLFALFILSILNPTAAQSCLPEGITFTTQGQVDSFRINYPDCTEIEGSLTISGEDISQLDSLMGILSVASSLVVDNCDALSSLEGLNHINSVGPLIISK
ncbi:MAG: hypothetical protein H6558_09615 [Lewinellaceae bacterium]|nr:hypothetical protein [Lewinellaceae bacterium]MCB9290204.1 hypothetical protein [Lewinellaceae bacterium]